MFLNKSRGKKVPVIGIKNVYEDAVYYYSTLLTTYIQVYFYLNIFWTKCTTYGYSLYTQLAHLWVWLITSSSMTLLVNATIHICTYLQVYISGGNTKHLTLYPLPFTKDTLSAEALTLFNANMHDVFKHLGICIHVYTTTGIDGTW